MKNDSFEGAFIKMLKRLRGAYAIVAVSVEHPKVMLAARLSSPLVLGIGNGELFLASDVSALVGDVKRVVYLDDGEMVALGEDGYVVKTLSNRRQKKEEIPLEWGSVSGGERRISFHAEGDLRAARISPMRCADD
jgi:glucosamine--fructose-6-phosphate aminotransferase (isomerizing)